jgi:hypothetical protein
MVEAMMWNTNALSGIDVRRGLNKVFDPVDTRLSIGE